MKKLTLLLLLIIYSCGDRPPNQFSYSEPSEKNQYYTLMEQFHDYIAKSEKYFDEYELNPSLYKGGVYGTATLVIDESLYDYIKSFGVGNYPDYPSERLRRLDYVYEKPKPGSDAAKLEGLDLLFRQCLISTRLDKESECDLSYYKF